MVTKQEVSMFDGEPLFASLSLCSPGSHFTDAHTSCRGVYWPLAMEPDVLMYRRVFAGREATAVSYNKLRWCLLWGDSWVSIVVRCDCSIYRCSKLIIVRQTCPGVAFATGQCVGWDSRGPSLVAHRSILFSRIHRVVQSLDTRQSS